MNDKVKSVVIVGGTHGNELTGIHLVQSWKKNQREKDFSDFSVDYLIANTEARTAKKRYLEHDLNRCFKKIDLENPSLNSLEQTRAKEINQLLGPKGAAKTDFILDLHTSTANMQINIVLTRIDPFHLQLAAYLKQQLDNVVITSEIELMDDHHFLESIATRGIVIEVGAIPQGALEYPCFEKTQSAIEVALDFVSYYNHSNNDQVTLPDALDEALDLMSYHSKIVFPVDDSGEICAVVHPDLIGKAYPQIKNGDVLFKGFDGKDILYQGETTHLAFINEAAYYDQKIAMCCCRPARFSLETCLRVD